MAFDWALITAVATVLGVIGGLISVVFLVYEVRRNAQAIEGSSVQALMSLEQQVFSVILANAKVYLRGCAKAPDLTEVEKLEFTECVGMIMSMTYSAFAQHTQNLIDDEVWEAYENAARNRLSTAGFREAWDTIQRGYPTSFQEAVGRIIAVQEPASASG